MALDYRTSDDAIHLNRNGQGVGFQGSKFNAEELAELAGMYGPPLCEVGCNHPEHPGACRDCDDCIWETRQGGERA